MNILAKLILMVVVLSSTSVYAETTTLTKMGNTVYSSDGKTYTKMGDTIYGSDGSTIRQQGSQIVVNKPDEYKMHMKTDVITNPDTGPSKNAFDFLNPKKMAEKKAACGDKPLQLLFCKK